MALNPKSRPLRHAIAWIIVSGVETALFIGDFANWTPGECLLVAFNIISLPIVFYATYFVMRQFFDNISWQHFWVMDAAKKWHYLLRVQWLIVAVFVFAYIVSAIGIDNLFSKYPYAKLSHHIHAKMKRIILYVGGALLYAHYRAEKHKSAMRELADKNRLSEMIGKIYKFKELSIKLDRPELVN